MSEPAPRTQAARGRRWLAGVVGGLAVVLGVVLVLNPFYSLSALVLGVVVGLVLVGLGELLDESTPGHRWPRIALGVGLILAAAVVAAWPGLTLGVIALMVGAGLVVEGVLRLASAVRGTVDQRVTATISAFASLLLGLLAIAWPDVTVFVIAVVVGIRLVTYGLGRVGAAVRWPRPTPADATARPGLLRRFARTVGAVTALAVALALLALSSFLHRNEPVPDAFYTPPASVPSEPGRLLRAEPFTRGMPDHSRAWRILYTTTRDEDDPAVASALVVVSADAPAGPRPVLAWAHGTTGYEEGCAPTLLEDPLGSGAMPALDQVLAEGWLVVATDYVGLGTAGPHPYLVGQGEARSVLDAVRAARQLDGVVLAEQTVVWGHSQGGHAALWTGIVQPGYAPDVPLSGVAALAPASNLPGLVGALDEVTGGALFASFVVQAYSDIYPDVAFDRYIRAAAQVQVREMAARCLHEPEVFVSIVQSLLFGQSVVARDPATGPLGRRLAENIPDGPIAVPVLIGQGEADALVLPSAQASYVADRCAAGGTLEYRSVPGRDHLSVLDDDSPLVPYLLSWTEDRFDARAAPSTCPTD